MWRGVTLSIVYGVFLKNAEELLGAWLNTDLSEVALQFSSNEDFLAHVLAMLAARGELSTAGLALYDDGESEGDMVLGVEVAELAKTRADYATAVLARLPAEHLRPPQEKALLGQWAAALGVDQPQLVVRLRAN